MGFLDSLLGEEKETPAQTPNEKGGLPLGVVVNFAPVRLSAMKENAIRMIVKITNKTDEEQLVSFDVLVAKSQLIGFDPTCINKHTEKKIGKVAPGATVEGSVSIYGTNQTKVGDYPFKLVAYAHYLDYDKVIHKVEKRGEIRVV